MKKIFLSLIAVMAGMSINAQVVKVYDTKTSTTEPVATYTNSDEHTYKVVFEEEPTTGTTNGHAWVKIGGVNWATMNLGATTVAGNPATCYGDYYAWGETEPRYTSITISGENSVSIGGGWKGHYYEGYSTMPDYTGTTLDADHDAATQNWGSDWRTPTRADFQALAKACTGSSDNDQTPSTLSSSRPTGGIYWLSSDQTYLSEYKGVAGILFVDKTNTNKRVFFPAAGYWFCRNFRYGGSSGVCWSSSLDTDKTSYAYYLDFSSSEVDPSDYYVRSNGYTVRPVSE